MFCFSCHFVYMVNTQIDTGVLAACFRVDRENKRSSYCLVQLYEPTHEPTHIYPIPIACAQQDCWEPVYRAIINPRRACAARVTVVVLCVCLSVCLFVTHYSRTTGYEAAYERYQQIQCYKGRKNNVAILLKRLRSRDMA